MESQENVYDLPTIFYDLIAAFGACLVPIDRGGFHNQKSNWPQLQSEDLTPTDAFHFELARIWLRNFSPNRQVETRRKFQWGAHQLVFPSGYRPEGGIFILAAQSLGFEVDRCRTALSDKYNLQILLVNIENTDVIGFFRHESNLAKTEIDIFCATPAVRTLMEHHRVIGESLVAALASANALESALATAEPMSE